MNNLENTVYCLEFQVVSDTNFDCFIFIAGNQDLLLPL